MSKSLSKGAQKIVNILKATKVNFVIEYSFPNCKSLKGKPLYFDIAIMGFFGAPTAIIEFDGEQHFKHIKHFAKEEKDYKRAQERDRIKNKYCIMNKIPLYRIPYWEIDNVNMLMDIFQDKYKVKSKYHNDFLIAP